MQLKFKIIAVVIAILILAVPGLVFAQNPDLSQNPSPDQATVPQDQGQYQGQGATQDQEQDALSPNSADSMSNAPYDQNNDQNANQDSTQSDRPPMSELPPKPSPNGPGMQGPPSGQGNSDQADYHETSGNTGVARVSLIHGDISTRRGDSGEWSAAQLNAPLMAGDSVSTGDKARTELQLDYANILRLAEHTQANITNLKPSQIQIQLGHGMANYTVLRNSDADAEIDTPNVSIRTERRESSFRVLVTADDHTEILVRRGEVEITTPQGGTRVGENQFITVRGTGDQTQYKIGEAPNRDDWDQWNSDRDRMINTSVSRKHTNDYYTGSQDLDAYGNWRDVPDYGSAWFPNEGADWSPYSAGNWTWQPYWGWTWVSNDPWGWAPYHYGRWFEYNGAWGWWPGPAYPYYRPIWSPAYVSFFGYGGGVGIGVGWGSIGWFPIGPCDTFYPWWGGYRGRFNVTNINIINRPHPYRGGRWNGIAPLHGGNRFSNVNRAMRDPHFRGATSVSAGQFGHPHTNFQRVNQSVLRSAHFTTGNLPVVPTRQNLSASGRPAAPSTLVNRGGNRFFSPHGTPTPHGGPSFDREQARISNAMRQNGVSPVNGNPRGFVGQSGNRMQQPGLRDGNLNQGNRVGGNREVPRPGSRSDQGFRNFNQSPANTGRPPAETRGNTNWGNAPRPGNSMNAAPRQGSANSGGWQRFTPMPPRASQPPASRSYNGSGMEGRGSYNAPRNMPDRGSYNAPRSYDAPRSMQSPPSYNSPRGQAPPSYNAPRGYEGRGSYNTPRYPSSEGRAYGGGGSSRPPLNMRQPIVTPRSSGSYPGGGRAPSFSRPAPSYGGAGGRAPSGGGGGGGHAAPSGGGHSGGGSPHSGRR